MASEKITALIEEVKGLTVLELSELVHAWRRSSAPLLLWLPCCWRRCRRRAAAEKTEFDVVLAGFDAAAKIKVIKVVREITGWAWLTLRPGRGRSQGSEGGCLQRRGRGR